MSQINDLVGAGRTAAALLLTKYWSCGMIVKYPYMPVLKCPMTEGLNLTSG
ncbi:MAG: hypothetical protein JXI43_09265 [Tissierellales bacterium]|nr:hypothetical protein [Tissierellales bacterium]